MKICLLIRVYNRIEDLQYNLEIIRKTWSQYDYYVLVVSNGVSSGFALSNEIYQLSDRVIILEENVGHLNGNSQLLSKGVQKVNILEFDYIIILEADTWLYSDKLIDKYIKKLDESEAVWASARWYDRFYSLATDFAIIKATFLNENLEVFNFETYPECYVCNYLIDNGYSYIWIKENMNVHLPSYLKSFPYASKGRYYSFPLSRMVTHHVEDVIGGMVKKKKDFNIVAQCDFFHDTCSDYMLCYRNCKVRFIHFLDKFLLRRSWYSKREIFDFSKNYNT